MSKTKEIILIVINAIFFLISPLLFIWAVNTLFPLTIPYAFNTWLAGIVLIVLVRYHFKSDRSSYDPLDEFDDEFDDDMDDYYDSFDDPEERKEAIRKNIIRYQEYLNNKGRHPEQDS